MIPEVRACSTLSIAIGRYRTIRPIARTPGPSAHSRLPTQDGDSTPAGECVRHEPIECLPFRHDVRGASSAASNDASPPSPTPPPHDHQIDDLAPPPLVGTASPHRPPPPPTLPVARGPPLPAGGARPRHAGRLGHPPPPPPAPAADAAAATRAR